MTLSIDTKWKIVNDTFREGESICDDCMYFSHYAGSLYEPPDSECWLLDRCTDPDLCPAVQGTIIDDSIEREIND